MALKVLGGLGGFSQAHYHHDYDDDAEEICGSIPLSMPRQSFCSFSSSPLLLCCLSSVMFFPNTVYNPIGSDQLPLAVINDIYLLDLVDPSGFVQEISSKVSRVVVLDHHKTAVESLCGESSCSVGENVERVIDIRRSGATVAFDYSEERAGSGLKDLNVGSMWV